MAKFGSSALAVILACITTAELAAARRIVPQNPSSMMESATQIVSDPFASGLKNLGMGMFEPAQGIPCGLQGYKQSYFSGKVIRVATLEVGLTTTTFNVDNPDFIKLLTQVGFDKDLIGTPVKTQDFRQNMCTPQVEMAFPHACAFFAPANLALVCPTIAAGAGVKSIADGVKSIGGTISDAMPSIPSGISDPFASGLKNLGMGMFEPAQGSPCGLKGYKQSYFSAKVIRVATLEVGLTTTTFNVDNPDLIKLLTQVGFDEDLIGTPVKTQDFRQHMCTPQMEMAFRNGCDFFAPANLALVCPTIAAGAGVKSIADGVKSIGGTISDAMPSIPSGISDPFASGLTNLGMGMFDAAQGMPCGLKGYKQTYFSAKVIRVATLEVGQTTTTFDVTSSDFTRLLSEVGFDEGLIGTPVMTGEFRQKMCTPQMQKAFKDACDFFAPSNLARVCPVLAAGIGAGQLSNGFQSLTNRIRNAMPSTIGQSDA